MSKQFVSLYNRSRINPIWAMHKFHPWIILAWWG